MKNVPEKIYLNIDNDGFPLELEDDFKELVGISWCEDKINNTDLEYVSLNKQKQHAIDFAKWMRDETILDGAPKIYYRNYKLYNPEKSRYTIDELYEIFNSLILYEKTTKE